MQNNDDTFVERQPKFKIGDSVMIELDNKNVLCKIGFYPNGKVAEYTEDLSMGLIYSYSHLYRREPYDTRHNAYHFSDDGKLYAIGTGRPHARRLHYLAIVPSGQHVSVLERDILTASSHSVLTRTFRNIHSKKGMKAFKEVQDDDKLFPHVPQLNNDLNDYIQSYLTETPLSSNVNTGIYNRLNPGPPNRIMPQRAFYLVDEDHSDEDDNEEEEDEDEDEDEEEDEEDENEDENEDEDEDEDEEDEDEEDEEEDEEEGESVEE